MEDYKYLFKVLKYKILHIMFQVFLIVIRAVKRTFWKVNERLVNFQFNAGTNTNFIEGEI